MTQDQTTALIASLSNKTAKNVILLIGDGMGILKLPLRVTMPKALAANLKELMPCR